MHARHVRCQAASHPPFHRALSRLQGNKVCTPRILVFDLARSEGLQRAMMGSAATSLTRQAFSGALPRRRGAGGRMRSGQVSEEEEEEAEDAEEAAEELIHAVEAMASSQLPSNAVARLLAGAEGAGGEESAAAALESALADLDLEGAVGSWGDYGKARFDPRTLLGVGSRTAVGDELGSSLASSGLGGSSTSFAAFGYGSEYFSEGIEEAVRSQLEAADGLAGVQAVVDIDSGFGSLAVEVLAYLRDECPRAPFLVLGAMPPRPAAMMAGGEASSLDYASRDRSSLRDMNVGMAFAQFATDAGADLGALFIPLSLQPYADTVAAAGRAAAHIVAAGEMAMQPGPGGPVADLHAWLPGLQRMVAARHYSTSALLAAGWDTATLPFRRSAGCGRGDEPLPFCRSEAEALRRDAARTGSGVDVGTAHNRMGGGGEAHDGRSRAGAPSPSSSSLFDPAIEDASGALVALSPVLGMKEWAGLLAPTPSRRVASLELAFPTPLPRASATVLDAVLRSALPLHASRLDTFTPLSWVASTPLPRAYYPSAHPSRVDDAFRPFAHVLSVRGVGTHNVGVNGGYASTLAAYGAVLDGFMGRTPCRAAGHVVLRTPLPLPLTFPRLLPPGMYDYAGAYVRGGGGGGGLPPFVPSSEALALAMQAASAGGATPGEGSPFPFSIPAMAAVSNGPRYGPCLAAVAAAFARRDRAVSHLYAAADRSSSRSAIEAEEVQAVLAGLADDYEAGGTA